MTRWVYRGSSWAHRARNGLAVAGRSESLEVNAPLPTLPPVDGVVNHAPHVVILGAGASIAAYQDWGRTGNALPSMQGLIDTLALRGDIESAGFNADGLNFEAFYDALASTGAHAELRRKIEAKVYSY